MVYMTGTVSPDSCTYLDGLSMYICIRRAYTRSLQMEPPCECEIRNSQSSLAYGTYERVLSRAPQMEELDMTPRKSHESCLIILDTYASTHWLRITMIPS